MILLFFEGGGSGSVLPTITYPFIIYLTEGRLAIRLAGNVYQEL